MASINVTIKLTDKVSSKLTTMNKKLNGVVKGFTNVKTSVNQLNKTVGKSITSTNRLTTALNKANKVSLRPVKKQVDNIDKSLRTAGKSTNWLASKLKWLASVYLGVMGGKAIIGGSDAFTSAQNMYRYAGMEQGMNKTQANNFADDAIEKIFGAAQRSRSSYAEMLDNVGKGMVLAPDAFGNNMDNAIAFQEIMAKTYKMGNKSAAEQASSMYQLMQALGSGVLQGDELRSVREGATMAYKVIEDFAQGIYKTEESLKDLASEGKITSDLVVAAILDAEDEVNKAFGNTTATFSEMWQMFKDNVMMAFRPFLTTLNEIANSPAGQFIGEKLTAAVWALGNAFTWVGNVIGTVTNWIADNWNWLGGTIQNVGAIMLIYLGVIAVGWLAVHWATLLVVGAVLLAAYIFNEFGISASDIIGFVCGLVMFLASVLWDALITALKWTAQFFIITGTAGVLMAQIVVQGLLWIVLAVWSVIQVLLLLIRTIGNGLTAAAKQSVILVARYFVDLANNVLNVLKTIGGAIDAVFGSNLASTVQGWMDTLDGKVLALETELNPNGDLEKIGDDWKNSLGTLGQMWKGEGQYDDWNITDNMANTFNTGKDWMGNVEDFANQFMIDPTQAWDTGFNFGKNFGSGLNTMFDSNNIKVDKTKGVNVTGLDDMLGDLGDNVGKIGKDTGDISKKMDLTEDDLKYLRMLAEAEAINRFTTAEIKVDMTNHNTMTGSADYAGFVTYLGDHIREELAVAAEGVHAYGG